MTLLTPQPSDDEAFVTPEMCRDLWHFKGKEIDTFANQIVTHRNKSKLRADGSFLFSFAQEQAAKILARRK